MTEKIEDTTQSTKGQNAKNLPTAQQNVTQALKTSATKGKTGSATAQKSLVTPKMCKKASRKPFIIYSLEPAKERERELSIFTHAKKLSEYIFVITEKSPKKYRWSIVTRLQNCAIEVVDNLYQANFQRDEQKRLAYQIRAGVCLRILDHYAEVAKKMQAITIKQMFYIAKLILEARKLLGGWTKNVKK